MEPTSYIAFELLDSRIDEDDAALEAFNIIVHVLDAGIRVLHNISISITKFMKDFKRSELKFYHDSHRLKIQQMYDNPNLDVHTLQVPIPHQMHVSYKEALEILRKDIHQLDIITLIDSIKQFVPTIAKDLQNGTESEFVAKLQTQTKEITRLSKDEVTKSIRAMFSDRQKDTEVAFRKAIGTVADFKQIDDSVLGLEPFLQQVPTICRDIATVEKIMNDLVTSLENTKTYSSATLRALHNYIYAIATQIDAFGLIAHRIQVIEHNVVLILNSLVQRQADS